MSKTNALEKSREKVASVRALLEKSKPQIAMALPRHINPDRILRIAMTSLQKNPKLLDCDPTSFLGAVIQSAQLGLEPDGITGQAYLIPYWNGKKKRNEVNFQAGYQGLMDLARRSGEISNIIPRVVYEKDEFEYHFGLDKDYLKHVPTTEVDAGKPTFVYCIVRLKDGSVQYEVWPVAKVEAHRKKFSRSSDNGPWVTHWEMMAKKTLIIQVLKYCPKSIELAKALALDELADSGIPQDLGGIIDVSVDEPENGKGRSINGDSKGALDQLVEGEKAAKDKGSKKKTQKTESADAPTEELF
mgnify:CR=1 FL=1